MTGTPAEDHPGHETPGEAAAHSPRASGGRAGGWLRTSGPQNGRAPTSGVLCLSLLQWPQAASKVSST